MTTVPLFFKHIQVKRRWDSLMLSLLLDGLEDGGGAPAVLPLSVRVLLLVSCKVLLLKESTVFSNRVTRTIHSYVI
jgi:hypothetical protein